MGCSCCKDEGANKVSAKSKHYIAEQQSKTDNLTENYRLKTELHNARTQHEAEKRGRKDDNKKLGEQITQLKNQHERERGSTNAQLHESERKRKEEKHNHQQKEHQSNSAFGRERSKLHKEIAELKDEKDYLLTRLSAIAGAKLTDGNAAVADISDENRPTKLSEKYSELYDNEWTDIFEVLSKGSNRSEEEICFILARAFCAAYEMCKEKALGDLQRATDAVKSLYGFDVLPKELSKEMKDKRKKLFHTHTQTLLKMFMAKTEDLFQDKIERQSAEKYLQKCIEISWLMAIQDPQVYIDTNLKRNGEQLDAERFRPYTKSGRYIDYIVWPTMYLYKGVGILMKGVAQPTDEKRRSDYENLPISKPENQELLSDITKEATGTDKHTSHDTSDSELMDIDEKKRTTDPEVDSPDAEQSHNGSVQAALHKRKVENQTFGDSDTNKQMSKSPDSKRKMTTISVRK